MGTEQITESKEVSLPYFTYPTMVMAFNHVRVGRFVTKAKLREIHKNNFGVPSEIVLENFIKRSLERFIVPPIKKEDGVLIKTRNISKKEIDHLSMAERVREILGNQKI
jgi:hypothetical protein